MSGGEKLPMRGQPALRDFSAHDNNDLSMPCDVRKLIGGDSDAVANDLSLCAIWAPFAREALRHETPIVSMVASPTAL